MEQALTPLTLHWLTPETEDLLALRRQASDRLQFLHFATKAELQKSAAGVPAFLVGCALERLANEELDAWNGASGLVRVLLHGPDYPVQPEHAGPADVLATWDQFLSGSAAEILLQAQARRLQRAHALSALDPAFLGAAAQGTCAQGLSHPLANALQGLLGNLQLGLAEGGLGASTLEHLLGAARLAKEMVQLQSGMARALDESQLATSSARIESLQRLLQLQLRRGFELRLVDFESLLQARTSFAALVFLCCQLLALAQERCPGGAQLQMGVQNRTGHWLELWLSLSARPSGAPLPAATRIWLEHRRRFEEMLDRWGVSRTSNPAQSEAWRLALALPMRELPQLVPARVLLLLPRSSEAQDVAQWLAELGYEVIVVSSSVQVLEHIRRGGIDLLIADEGLADLPGPILAEEALALDASLRCFLVSAFSQNNASLPSVRLSYCLRPLNQAQLVGALATSSEAKLAANKSKLEGGAPT